MTRIATRIALALAATFALLSALATPAGAQQTGLEYRLKVEDGVPFAFDHAEEMFFARRPFMAGKDFAAVVARKSANPNTPGEWEVVLTHAEAGRAKFRAVANADRSREFCLLFHSTVYDCEAFPPDVKDVYDKDITVTGNFDRAKAEKLAAAMRREIARGGR